jgi:hypothetical protein
MAKIHEEILTVRISRLIRDDTTSNPDTLSTQDLADALTAIAEELCGPTAVVEVAPLS